MNDRYKAQKPMQTVFVRNSDDCGDHIFTQIARIGRVAVYHRTDVETGKSWGYETILINVVPIGTVRAEGAKPTTVETESYPGAKAFGKLGWHFYNKAAALAKMDELVKKNSIIIPEGEFTFLDFASTNGLPINKGTADLLTKLLKEKKILFLRKDGNAQIFKEVD